MSSDQERLSRDTVFDLLSSARRRYILFYLRQHGGEETINELATQLAAWENDAEPEELTSQDEKRVYVSLYQTHVPKLEDSGIVEYDSETSTVTLTDRAYELDQFLTAEDREEFPWQLYYLGLAVVSSVLFGLVVLDVPLFGLVPPVVAGSVVILAFAASAVVQYYIERSRGRGLPSELGVDR